MVSEIKNFLSEDECDAIVQLAKEKGMKQPTAAIKNLNLPKGNDHSAFDKWDKNLDGSLSNEEVFTNKCTKCILNFFLIPS